MADKAIKAYLLVTAGIVPGLGLAEFTKRWDWKPSSTQDGIVEMTAEELLKFYALSNEAHDYAQALQNPGFVRWVNTEWHWLAEGETVSLGGI